MPIVPTTQARGGGLGAVNRTRITAEDFGSAEANALGQVGRAVQGVGTQALDRITQLERDRNEADVKRLQQEYDAARHNISQDLYNKKGIDAIANEENTRQAMTEARSKILARAQRAEVRDALDLLTSRSEQAELVKMNKFMAGERERDFISTSNSRIQMYQTDAAANIELVADGRVGIMSEVAKQADRLGWSAEQTKVETQRAITNLHRGVLAQLAAQDPKLASAYLEANRDDILPSVVDTYKKSTEAAETLGKAYAIADDIVASHDSEEEAMAAVRKISDPKVRKQAATEVQNRFIQERRFEKQLRNKVAGNVAIQISEGASLQQILAEDWEAFNTISQDPNTLNRLRLHEERRMRGELYSAVSDGETFKDLKRLSTKDMAELDPSEFQSSLTESEYRQLINAQAAARDRINEVQSKKKFLTTAEKEIKRRTPHQTE